MKVTVCDSRSHDTALLKLQKLGRATQKEFATLPVFEELLKTKKIKKCGVRVSDKQKTENVYELKNREHVLDFNHVVSVVELKGTKQDRELINILIKRYKLYITK